MSNREYQKPHPYSAGNRSNRNEFTNNNNNNNQNNNNNIDNNYKYNNYNSNQFHNRNNSSQFNSRGNNRRKFNFRSSTSAELYVYPAHLYDEKFPEFQKPLEIGTLISEKRKAELDAKKHKYEFDERGFKYLVLPENVTNCNYDLKIGLDKFVPHNPHQQGIDQMLKWILENKTKMLFDQKTSSNASNSDISPKLFKADFICWRGLLASLLVTPYERLNDWMFSVIRYRGNFYLCEIETDRHRNERLNMDEKTRNFTYWGHKFESYITSDSPQETPGNFEDAPDPENNFGTVVMSKLEQHYMLYAAEIDCCKFEKHHALNDYCEIKTSKGQTIDDLNIERNKKFLKWWVQSYLVNIETMKIGLRDDDGIVHSIVDFEVAQIYKAANNKNWKANVCFNFLKTILDFIKTYCVKEDQLYIFSREKGSNIVQFYEASATLNDASYFLRDWFKTAI